MCFEPGDLFSYIDEYSCRRGKSSAGIVLNVLGRIHEDIDDVCLTVFIGGKITEEWSSFLVKLN